MISVGSLFGYFVVWVVKFLLLNRLFARGRTVTPADETVTVGG